jgi:hypothetical protein
LRFEACFLGVSCACRRLVCERSRARIAPVCTREESPVAGRATNKRTQSAQKFQIAVDIRAGAFTLVLKSSLRRGAAYSSRPRKTHTKVIKMAKATKKKSAAKSPVKAKKSAAKKKKTAKK